MYLKMLFHKRAAAAAAAVQVPGANALMVARITLITGYVRDEDAGMVRWATDESTAAAAAGPGALAAELARITALGINPAIWVARLGNLGQSVTDAAATATAEAQAASVGASTAATRLVAEKRVVAAVNRSIVSAVYVAAEVGRVAAACADVHAGLVVAGAAVAAIAAAAAAQAAATSLADAAKRAAQLAIVLRAISQLEESISDDDTLRGLIASTGQLASFDLDPTGVSSVYVLSRHHDRFVEILEAYELAYPMGSIVHPDGPATPLDAADFQRDADLHDSSVYLPRCREGAVLSAAQANFEAIAHGEVAAEAHAARPRIYLVVVRNLPLALGWIFALAGIPCLARAVFPYSGLHVRLTKNLAGRGPPWMLQLEACPSWFSVALGFTDRGCLPPFLFAVLLWLPCLVNGGGAHGNVIITWLLYRVTHAWMVEFSRPQASFLLMLRGAPLVGAGGSAAGHVATALARQVLVAAAGVPPVPGGAGAAPAAAVLPSARVAMIRLGNSRCKFLAHGALPPL